MERVAKDNYVVVEELLIVLQSLGYERNLNVLEWSNFDPLLILYGMCFIKEGNFEMKLELGSMWFIFSGDISHEYSNALLHPGAILQLKVLVKAIAKIYDFYNGHGAFIVDSKKLDDVVFIQKMSC